MIVNIDHSQDIVGNDMLKALKSSFKRRRKHALRLLQLYGEPGLHIICNDRKHMAANTFFKLFTSALIFTWL